MVELIFFGVVGGLLSALSFFPYGLLAAFLAYMVGGALFALIPGLLRGRHEKDG
jgi:ABC-type uncharacterized transport system permease subunit